jgi:hypothetical protein
MSPTWISLCWNGSYRAARAKKCNDDTHLVRHQHPPCRTDRGTWLGPIEGLDARAVRAVLYRSGSAALWQPPHLDYLGK